MVKFLHTRIRVSDIETSIDFYRKLGYWEGERKDSPQGNELAFLHLPGNDVFLELCGVQTTGFRTFWKAFLSALQPRGANRRLTGRTVGRDQLHEIAEQALVIAPAAAGTCVQILPDLPQTGRFDRRARFLEVQHGLIPRQAEKRQQVTQDSLRLDHELLVVHRKNHQP